MAMRELCVKMRVQRANMAETRIHATFTPRCVPQKWHALPRRIACHCGDKMRASVNVALLTHSLTYKRSICFCTYTKMLKTAHTQTRPISKLISWTYDEAHTTDFVELNLTSVKISRKNITQIKHILHHSHNHRV